MKIGSGWRRLDSLTHATKGDIEKRYEELYGVRKLPSSWVFNDFGHQTCYLYKDKNKNARRDVGEPIHGEFLHTTPETEAATLLRPTNVRLVGSHGCVHLKPTDIRRMIDRGYLRKNALFVVHPYHEMAPAFPRGPRGKGHIELHFFPASARLLVLVLVTLRPQ